MDKNINVTAVGFDTLSDRELSEIYLSLAEFQEALNNDNVDTEINGSTF